MSTESKHASYLFLMGSFKKIGFLISYKYFISFTAMTLNSKKVFLCCQISFYNYKSTLCEETGSIGKFLPQDN